jgi:sulfite exporter TauE/SafE
VINSGKISNFFKTLFIILFVIALFVIVDKLQLSRYINVQSNFSFSAFFFLGIVAGISSCAALVGGILLSLTKQWNEEYIGESEKKRFIPHTLFHLGRIVAYTFLGGVLGLIGKFFTFNNSTVGAILVIGISLIMLVLAVQMLNIRWAQKIRFALPKSFSRAVANEKEFSGKFIPFLLGCSTFFLPCGFTLIAQGVALTTGSFLKGALVMLLFALGTLPTLLGISISGVKMNSKPKSTALFNQVAGILIIFFVIYNLNSQFNVLGLPSINDIKLPERQEQNSEKPSNNATQELDITAKGFTYIVNGSATLKAGVKTTLIVDNQGIQGCASYMVGKGLFDGYFQLKPGENTITFTPKKGTYKITCSMGMVSPIIITVN